MRQVVKGFLERTVRIFMEHCGTGLFIMKLYLLDHLHKHSVQFRSARFLNESA